MKTVIFVTDSIKPLSAPRFCRFFLTMRIRILADFFLNALAFFDFFSYRQKNISIVPIFHDSGCGAAYDALYFGTTINILIYWSLESFAPRGWVCDMNRHHHRRPFYNSIFSKPQ